MTGPAHPDVPLLEVTRGELVESRHRGTVVLLERDGSVAIAAGDPDAAVYARSSLKPLQTAAMLSAGFDGPNEWVAMASASHNAEAAHRETVSAMLAAAGLSEAELQCPPALPHREPDVLDWVRGGGMPARLCHNCSGKHSAMLATCTVAGWDPSSYLSPEHPLQRAIAVRIEQLSATPISASSVDGCGAPAHALPLTGLARAFAAIAGGSAGAEQRRVATSMRAHPYLVAGTGRETTELMAGVDGLVCKDGADGVWAAALADGRAFAAKIADGGSRGLGPLLAAALTYWGIEAPAVRRWASVPTLGGGRPVGEVRWSPELRTLLSLPPA